MGRVCSKQFGWLLVTQQQVQYQLITEIQTLQYTWKSNILRGGMGESTNRMV
jgi:hypothetical protein